MSEWQDIATATGHGPFIVTDGDNMAMATRSGMYRDIYGGRYQGWNVYPQAWEGSDDRGGLATLDFKPTKWMPLPKPPGDDK